MRYLHKCPVCSWEDELDEELWRLGVQPSCPHCRTVDLEFIRRIDDDEDEE